MQRPCILVAVVVLGLVVYRQASSVWQGRAMEDASQVNALSVFRSAPEASSRPKILDTYGRLPLHFEANQGQTDEQVQFLARGKGYSLFLTGTEAVWLCRNPRPLRKHSSWTHACFPEAPGVGGARRVTQRPVRP